MINAQNCTGCETPPCLSDLIHSIHSIHMHSMYSALKCAWNDKWHVFSSILYLKWQATSILYLKWQAMHSALSSTWNDKLRTCTCSLPEMCLKWHDMYSALSSTWNVPEMMWYIRTLCILALFSSCLKWQVACFQFYPLCLKWQVTCIQLYSQCVWNDKWHEFSFILYLKCAWNDKWRVFFFCVINNISKGIQEFDITIADVSTCTNNIHIRSDYADWIHL